MKRKQGVSIHVIMRPGCTSGGPWIIGSKSNHTLLWSWTINAGPRLPRPRSRAFSTSFILCLSRAGFDRPFYVYFPSPSFSLLNGWPARGLFRDFWYSFSVFILKVYFFKIHFFNRNKGNFFPLKKQIFLKHNFRNSFLQIT